ncbi:MAG: multiubiquitin domain-containing protein [Actinomycetia bacterium]|nr:multiubiquitin domain-containing protein [Actinomycetes bacterium]
MVAEDKKPYPIDVEDHKTVTIVVEGTPHEWPEEYITYEQVVTLDVPDYSPDSQITYTVKYKEGPRNKPEGTLSRGGTVKVVEKMVFSVSGTGQS